VQPSSEKDVFELYRKYQHKIHNDKLEDITMASFKRFLVDSPLFNNVKDTKSKKTISSTSSSSSSYSYGTFHMQYKLDNRLIAVSVIDILPSGLSSVYFFYDPDEKHLVLGKFSALHEINFCKTSDFKYYYMGFYIHSCSKMKYKSEYFPSELMCPTTYKWYPIEMCIPLLNKFKFTPLEPSLAEEREVWHIMYQK
jgi:arginine-tRNA-protein transferase